MKLIIQIPCYNESDSLPAMLKELPRQVKGFDRVEWLIIDDGSSDRTAEVAKQCGVDHVVRFTHHRGLAAGFMAGLDACLKRGADVIVNTDADNQYRAADIPLLVAPITEGRADIVIGARPTGQIEQFSAAKKLLQKIGSAVVRWVSHTDVPDAPSGFRAISRDAALQLNVFNEYTYTLETIIQAGQKGMAVVSVPVRVNPAGRPSRLVKSIFSYVVRSGGTILKIFVVYRPFSFFMTAGSLLFFCGFAVGLRYLYFFARGHSGGHVQSLILASILLGIGFETMLIAFVANLLAVNRKLMENVQYLLRKWESGKPPERR
ncbi:MAG TPA: glycosyltransferase family 2 protein [Candidatus Omnitrophota bacterium]|nr:glycosyltransferase family 2 protein [Candidatus Omnitrophota bacterium]